MAFAKERLAKARKSRESGRTARARDFAKEKNALPKRARRFQVGLISG
jgi:hypothetical protein